MTRAEALVALLALPVPADLVGIGHRLTLARDPARDPEVIKRDLGTAYVAWRRQEWTGGDSVVSVGRLTIRIRAVDLLTPDVTKVLEMKRRA